MRKNHRSLSLSLLMLIGLLIPASLSSLASFGHQHKQPGKAFTLPYAVITIENQVGNVGDIVVSFYDDQAHTIPATVSNVTVNYRLKEEGGLCGCPLGYYYYSTTVSGSSYVLQSGAVLWEEVHGSGEVDYIYRYWDLEAGDYQ